jgi:protein involved in polysaccharide export with SLBB domain
VNVTLAARSSLPKRTLLLLVTWAWSAGMAVAQTQTGTGQVPPQNQPSSSAEANRSDPASNGPVRLRQGQGTTSADERMPGDRSDTGERADRPDQPPLSNREPPYVAGEFERYVQRQVGPAPLIRRLGSELVTGSTDAKPGELSPLVPADYIVGPGDEVLVTLWGSVDADLRLIVDRAGRISIPRVGAIQVSGLKHEELADVVARRVGQVFRNFQSSVSLGQLRGIRVFVTGFVLKPGAYTVNSLSTVVAALLKAGGPSASGSFRDIEVRRGPEVLGRFDLYDLLLRGDRTSDRVLQAGDVVHVGPVGVQVGFIGSVNRPAILELRPGETVGDALRMVGGFSAVADRTRLAVERLQDRNSGRVAQLDLPRDDRSTLGHGDVLRAFSAVAAALPSLRQNKRVKVEGEVARPAEYVLPEGSSVRDAIRAAGGYMPAAYIFAAELMRESVQRTQQENYDRALRDLETDLARTAGTQRVAGSEEAGSQAARTAANDRLIARLRALRPSGRIVLDMPIDATELPDLALEDGDRIFIPARPNTVGVFGSVYNAATYLHQPGRRLDDYLRLAGGPTKGADDASVFVVRANGHVISEHQDASWFRRGNAVSQLAAEPGDTIFVPEEMDKTTFLQRAKDWTQVLYQLGIGLAAFQVFRTN